jgi:hypothetical protein
MTSLCSGLVNLDEALDLFQTAVAAEPDETLSPARLRPAFALLLQPWRTKPRSRRTEYPSHSR